MAKTPWEMADVGAEFSHQTALFAWAAMARMFGDLAANDPKSYSVAGHAQKLALNGHGRPVPELKWLHAIKNQGHGDSVRGGRSKAEGVRAGVFDMFLPFPMARLSNGIVVERFYGLYVELKKPGKHKTSDVQETFQSDIKAVGYAAEVCVGWEAARDVILRYLGR